MDELREPKKPARACETCGKQYDYVKRKMSEAELQQARISAWLYWETIPHPECDQIREQRQAEEERAKRKMECLEKMKKLFSSACVDETYGHKKTFETFKITTENEQAYRAMKAWSPEEDFGIMLVGTSGTGKSHLMLSLATECIERGLITVFSKIPQLFDSLRGGYSDESYPKQMDYLQRANVLLLDDLGAEKSTEWAEEKLTQIIDFRMEHHRPTFVSTNCKMQDLKGRFHERLLSRLMGSCLIFELKCVDRRREIFSERRSKFERKMESVVIQKSDKL